MGRGGLSNVDIASRIRQFIFLIVVTVLGMIVSSAFFGAAGKHHAINEATVQPSNSSVNIGTSQASF